MVEAKDNHNDRHTAGPENRGAKETRLVLRRRDLLKAMSAVPAALVPLASAGAQQQTKAQKAKPATPVAAAYAPKVLNEHEWSTVRVLCDLIVPADQRSGSATQVGVPEFIDAWLDFKRGVLLAEIRGGLTWLDIECQRQFSRDFVACSEAQQKQILDRIAYPKRAAPEDAAGVAFFNRLRDLVVAGFFSSQEGVKDLPYVGNQMIAEWNGCGVEGLEKPRTAG